MATVRDADVRRHYEIAVRERVGAHSGRRRRTQPAAARPAFRAVTRGRSPPQPTGPSASLLANRLVRGSGRGAGRTSATPCCSALLVLHPEIAAERLESSAQTHFAGKGLRRLRRRSASRAGRITRHFGRRAAGSAGTGGPRRALAAVLEKLRPGRPRRAGRRRNRARRGGLGRRCPLASSYRRVIYRAAGSGLGARARDERYEFEPPAGYPGAGSAQPSSRQRDEAGEAVIVHPFKRR